jgi:serine/threonine protein kinase
MPSIIGKTVGSYKVKELLGKGGMAVVYKAYDPALNRYVALKIMDAALGKEKDFVERFNREARVIANLENSHIVPVHHYGRYKGQPFLP